MITTELEVGNDIIRKPSKLSFQKYYVRQSVTIFSFFFSQEKKMGTKKNMLQRMNFFQILHNKSLFYN